MIATSRVASIIRGTVPFATWLAAAIQLGYLGYNLWEKYLEYRNLVEADRRAGFTRPLDEAIELVIKPRRVRRKENTTASERNEDQSEIMGGTSSNQENIPSSSHQNLTDAAHPETSMQENIDPINISSSSNNSDVKVVYDSSLIPNTKSNKVGQDDDEILTTTSTSIESTDSNKGICNDMHNECYICANTLNDSSRPVASLPFCYHSFHKKCLEGVLRWHPKCPICDVHIFCPI